MMLMKFDARCRKKSWWRSEREREGGDRDASLRLRVLTLTLSVQVSKADPLQHQRVPLSTYWRIRSLTLGVRARLL